MKTFAQFVQNREFFHGGISDDFHRRLREASNVESLYKLYAFCRLRYPDFYRTKQPFLACTGQQLMQRIWASFLEAEEA